MKQSPDLGFMMKRAVSKFLNDAESLDYGLYCVGVILGNCYLEKQIT